jgi:hypothetical protein
MTTDFLTVLSEFQERNIRYVFVGGGNAWPNCARNKNTYESLRTKAAGAEIWRLEGCGVDGGL